MLALSQAKPGRSYIIKWMFASAEILAFMQAHHIEECCSVQVIPRCMHGVIITSQERCLSIGNDISPHI